MGARRFRLAAALVVALGALAAGCGGSQAETIRVGVLAACDGLWGYWYDGSLAATELPLLGRGARLAGSSPRDGLRGAMIAGRPVELVFGCGDGLPELTLSKHLRLIDNWRDARRIRRYAEVEALDIVHAHLANDHSIAGRALAKSEGTRLVRTTYDGEGMKPTLRQRRALARTDALVCVASETARQAADELGFPRDRIHRVESPIDTERFDAARVPAASGTSRR